NHLSVDLNGDLVALNDDVLRKPLFIPGGSFAHVLDAVHTRRTSPICVRVVYLYLMPLFGPAVFLVLGMTVHTRVRSGHSHHFRLVLKVLEIRTLNVSYVEKVGPGSKNDNGTILDGERTRVCTDAPPVEGLAIKEFYPTFLLRVRGYQRQKNNNQRNNVPHKYRI